MKKRCTSLIITAAMPFALFGCSVNDIFSKSSSDSSESSDNSEISASEASEKYDFVDIEEVKEHAAQLLEFSETSGSSEDILKYMDILLNDIDTAAETLSLVTMDYYSDWNDAELEALYDSCYETFYVTHEIASYAFHNCYTAEEYAPLLEDYIFPENLEFYTNRALSVNRLIGYAKVDAELINENLDAYYDVINDMTKKDKSKNLAAAEIYLEILASYDTSTFYDAYNRDFSPDDALALNDTIIDVLVPARDSLESAISNMPEFEDIIDSPITFDKPFQVIADNAGDISAEIADYADYILENELFTITKGNKSYNGSFTNDLPLENEAMIYIHDDEDIYSLLTPIHEFGHFYASFFDETPTYLMANNIDIAEVQSQGMEVIFMNKYDDIYGDNSEFMRAYKIYDTLDSVASGFAIGEFEYNVLKNLDTMTPESVVELFDETVQKYGYDTNFYYISHLFEQPGYYISYGVSALAALDIWNASLDDYSKAVKMYTDIAHIPCNSDKQQFKSALKECGFDDVLNEEYIKKLVANIMEYAENIE